MSRRAVEGAKPRDKGLPEELRVNAGEPWTGVSLLLLTSGELQRKAGAGNIFNIFEKDDQARRSSTTQAQHTDEQQQVRAGRRVSAKNGSPPATPMDGLEFRRRGREMVDYMVDYLDNLESRRVTPQVEPGYLQELLPREAPQDPESWEAIMDDVEKKIMIGVTHWQHPRFHAYFPAGNAYPSILGDMLGDAIGCVGFSWAASPACTELETVMLDWLGKMVGLPNEFLSNQEGSKGGGVIQSSASECVLDCLLAARAQSIQRLKNQYGDDVEETTLLSKLMAYCSKEAHSCVEKAAMIGFVKLRILEPDENCSLRGETLRQAMAEDFDNGMVPFFVSTTLGTTGCCAFDRVDEIGPVCKEYGAWLHVDGAYGGNAFICPEFQYLMKGIEYASSFNMNPNKWMLVNFDCSTMWVKDRYKLTQALVVDPLYLQHSYSECAIDYRHWGIPLSRRFRSLKLWFVIRNYGVSGLQAYIREHCRLAKRFEEHVRNDDRFEVCNNVMTGLVCFRLVGDDKLNQKLLSNINASGLMHMVPASVQEKFVIRFCVCAPKATDADIDYAWKTIARFATDLVGKAQLLEEAKAKEDIAGFEEEDKDRVAANAIQTNKKNSSLQYKRSFFVRMVSDPKIYNPKIVSSEAQYEDEDDGTEDQVATSGVSGTGDETSVEGGVDKSEAVDGARGGEASGAHHPATKRKSGNARRTWISWPLAFILKSAGNNNSANSANRRNEDVALLAEKEVSMRFRNLSTRVTISPPGASSSQGSSPSEQKRFDNKEGATTTAGPTSRSASGSPTAGGAVAPTPEVQTETATPPNAAGSSSPPQSQADAAAEDE